MCVCVGVHICICTCVCVCMHDQPVRVSEQGERMYFYIQTLPQIAHRGLLDGNIVCVCVCVCVYTHTYIHTCLHIRILYTHTLFLSMQLMPGMLKLKYILKYEMHQNMTHKQCAERRCGDVDTNAQRGLPRACVAGRGLRKPH